MGNLMFSQRNNPYCDLLKISVAKLYILIDIYKLFVFFCIFALDIYHNSFKYKPNINEKDFRSRSWNK